MKNYLKSLLCLTAAFGIFSVVSCVEDIDQSNLYTFQGQTITDYIADNEEFSHFYEIIKCIEYDKLLSAYGSYTCFVPSNEGVLEYVDSLYNDTTNLVNPHNGMEAPGLVGIIGGTDEHGNVIEPNDSLCYDITLFHLLYSKMLSIEINKGNTLNTMMNRDIITSTGPNGEILINGHSKLEVLDVELENGIVHTVDHVIRRSNELVAQELSKHKEFSIFSEAMNACGLPDELVKLERENLKIPKKEYNEYIPQECKLGYTIFAESNAVFNNAGIQNLDQLIDSCRSWYADCKEWYDYYRTEGIEVSTGQDYKNPHHVLNMFLRYHIVECKVPFDRLYNNHGETQEAIVREYHETMLPYTLLKVTKVNNMPRINRWVENSTLTDQTAKQASPAIAIERRKGIPVLKDGFSSVNGFIHPIGSVLKYDAFVPSGVLNERMRFDVMAIMHETLSNNIRRATDAELRGMNGGTSCTGYDFAGNGTVRLPEDYCENLVVYNGSETKLCYLSGQNIGWANYQGDEMNCVGAYDFALRLPPVPEGLYEVRLGYSANGKRGMMQIYLGNSSDLTKMIPIDIPLDMRNTPSNTNTPDNPHPFTGWCNWKNCADYGIETDRNMRNLNFMRGPLGYTISGDGKPGNTHLRDEPMALRRIILKERLKQDEYWLRFKTMLPQNKSTQFHLEYIELVPENVYNNANYPEDMF